MTALDGTVFAFVASYELVGFEPPVDNDAVNVAKAGRAIPLKWRLYDLGGNPVTDLAPAAVHLTSVSVACAALTEGTDAVEEVTRMCEQINREYPNSIFFTSKLIFASDNWFTRLLHNQAALAVQRRLHLEGLQMVILPMKV